MSDNGAVTSYAAPNGMNQHATVGGQSLSYNDNRFNLTAYNGAAFTYDAQNQLMSATKGGNSVQFIYDGLGRCVKRTANGVPRFITYDDWNPLYEWDASGNPVAANMYGAKVDEIVGKWDPSLGFLFYKQDRHGNVVGLVNQGGTIVEKYRYDAFGQPTILSANNTQLSTSAVGNRFMFQGREWIAELGIYDYRHRMYHPQLGRFLQTDPIGLQTEGAKLSPGQKALFSPGGVAPEAFGSSEMNLYRYCGDDPVDENDPLGLAPGDPFGTPEAAARDVHNFINPTSIRENAEYGSIIYQVGDRFFASKPFSDGAGTRVTVGAPTDTTRVPEGGNRVGDYHSHGDYSIQGRKDPTTGQPIPQRVTGPNAKRDDAMRGYNSDHPSTTSDNKRARDAKKENPNYRLFLGTPSKEFKEYDGKKDWKL